MYPGVANTSYSSLRCATGWGFLTTLYYPIFCECVERQWLTSSVDQGHTQWGIISYKIKCSESSRDARVERSLSPAMQRTMRWSENSPQNTPRGRSRSQGDNLRDSRHSSRTGSDNDLVVGLPPKPPLYRSISTKKLSPTKKGTTFLEKSSECVRG